MGSKCAGSHGALWAKCKTFHSQLGEITVLGLKIERKNVNQCVGGRRMKDQGIQSPNLSAEKFFFLQLPRKHDDQSTFK